MKSWNNILHQLLGSHLNSRKGITRNEWLAILSLGVVVFGIATPYFIHTAASAARSASAANLQQWGIALNLYLTEYDNRLPDTGDASLPTEDTQAWYNSLPPYLSQTPLNEMAVKPQHGEPSLWVDPSLKKSKTTEFQFSYAMNAWLQPDPTKSAYKIYEIEDPSRVVFLTETAGDSPRIQSAEVDFRHGKKQPDPQAKAHVLFCDGHVELITQEDLKDNTASQDPQAPMSKISWVPFYRAPAPK
jgi:prepilin-type processing-associated H-X9-DG protein